MKSGNILELLQYIKSKTDYIASIPNRDWRMDDPIELSKQLSEEIEGIISEIETH